MPGKEPSAISYQLSDKNQKRSADWRLWTVDSQKGIAQLAILLLLLAGIGLGTYLVQQRTNILPFAQNSCEIGEDGEAVCTQDDSINPPEPGQKEEKKEEQQPSTDKQKNEADEAFCKKCEEDPSKKCQGGAQGWSCVLKSTDNSGSQTTQAGSQDTNGLFPSEGKLEDPNQKCANLSGDGPKTQCESNIISKNNETCAKDQVTYCDGGKAIRKTGGYFDSGSGKCVFDFFNVNEKDSECASSKGAFDGAVVKMSAAESQAVDRQRAAGERSSDAVCPSETVCKAGKRVIIYRTENEGKPGCTEKTYDTGNAQGCVDAAGNPKEDGTKLAGDAQADAERKLYEQGQQRVDLKRQLNNARDEATKSGKLDPKLTDLFTKAGDFLNQAQAEYDKCFTASGVKQDACAGTAEIANAQAVMGARLALIEAAAKGVPNVRVKADLAVGGATNTLMEARPSTGGGGKSRVFLVTDSTGKKANYVVLNARGIFVPANRDDLKALGLTQGADVSTIPTLFKDRIDKARCAVDKTCPDTGAVTTRTGQTGNSPAVPADNSVSNNGKCTDNKQCKDSNQYGKSTCTGGVCKAAQAPVQSSSYDIKKPCNSTTNKCPSDYSNCRTDGKCYNSSGATVPSRL